MKIIGFFILLTTFFDFLYFLFQYHGSLRFKSHGVTCYVCCESLNGFLALPTQLTDIDYRF